MAPRAHTPMSRRSRRSSAHDRRSMDRANRALSTYKEDSKPKQTFLNYVVLDPACGSGTSSTSRTGSCDASRRSWPLVTEWRSRRDDQQNKDSVFLPTAEHAWDRDRAVRCRPGTGDPVDGPPVGGRGAGTWVRACCRWPISRGFVGGMPYVSSARGNVIISNPPYHGSQNCARFWMRIRGMAQASFRRGLKDFWVYWFALPRIRCDRRSRRHGRDELDQPEPGSGASSIRSSRRAA